MDKFLLAQDENLSFKVSYQLQPIDKQTIDIYFSLPVEMGINPGTLNEENYFLSSIKTHSAYYSEQLHLPLVRSRFISQTKGEQADYRVNLNLFGYQIRIALDRDIKLILKEKTAEDFFPQAVELAEQTIILLKKLRRYSPPDKKLSAYFEHVDNYLSWFVEQSFLRLLSKGHKSSDFAQEREFISSFCKDESQYRDQCQYNSQTTIEDANRITNKMRLLQRLTEYGVVFKREVKNLNLNLKRLVRGGVTAVIMAFVMLLVLNARSTFTEVTVALIALLGVIYGLREIFKEDLTSLIWRKIQKGRPKWQNNFENNVTKKRMSYQTIWLEYITKKSLPPLVSELFKKRRRQNRQAARLLHFRSESKVIAKSFLPGYEEIQEQIYFNLTPFVRYLKRGEGRLYSLDGHKITKQAVERRYQINMVLVHTDKEKNQYLQRFKITLNRSEIIAIEEMDIAHH